jgi:hypothetical protein
MIRSADKTHKRVRRRVSTGAFFGHIAYGSIAARKRG